MTEELLTNREVTHLYHKNLLEHLRGILFNKRALLSFFGWILAIFTVVMTVLGAAAYFLDKSFQGFLSFAIVIAIAIMIAFGRAIHSYITGCPSGLETESRSAQRIAQLQRPKWEFKLARQLLHDRVEMLDIELRNMLNNRTFVPVVQQLDVEGYTAWANMRPANALRMIAVAKQLLIYDFPEALVSTEEKPANPIKMVTVVERIQRLYSDTLEFERASVEIEPPSELAKLHGYAIGWTEPIRSGVHQLFDFLDRAIGLPPRAYQSLEFTILFEEPTNLSRFNTEMEQLDHGLP